MRAVRELKAGAAPSPVGGISQPQPPQTAAAKAHGESAAQRAEGRSASAPAAVPGRPAAGTGKAMSRNDILADTKLNGILKSTGAKIVDIKEA